MFTSRSANSLSGTNLIAEMTGSHGTLYSVVSGMLNFLLKCDFLEGMAFGNHCVLADAKRKVAEICVRLDGSQDTGSGFLLHISETKTMLLTCKHLLFNKDGRQRKIDEIRIDDLFLQARAAFPFSRIDACLLELEIEPAQKGYRFVKGSLLEDVTTVGYPRLRLVERSPLLFHRGQINGWSDEPNSPNRQAVISADIAPGSSGGPVLNGFGAVVGMSERRIETNYEDGAARYCAMLPSELIEAEIEAGHLASTISLA